MSNENTLEVVNSSDRKAIGSVDLKQWDTIDGYLTQAARLHATCSVTVTRDPKKNVCGAGQLRESCRGS